MSEDRFFQQVNATMANYRPEVPQAVYSGMRKKLWWSNFTRLSATRFNIWYLAILITGSTALLNVGITENDSAASEVNQLQQVPNAAGAAREIPAQEGSIAESEGVDSEQNNQKVVVGKSDNVQSTQIQSDLKELEASSKQQIEVTEPAVKSSPAVSETKVQTAESVKNEPASKKGLKVKTYNAQDKKD